MRMNQRSSERVRRTNRVVVRVVQLGSETEIDAKLVDVSSGGVGFETGAKLEPGERLRVRVTIETTRIISQFAGFVEGSAVVRRLEEKAPGAWLVGAAWEKMDRAEREKWLQFMGNARPLLL